MSEYYKASWFRNADSATEWMNNLVQRGYQFKSMTSNGDSVFILMEYV